MGKVLCPITNRVSDHAADIYILRSDGNIRVQLTKCPVMVSAEFDEETRRMQVFDVNGACFSDFVIDARCFTPIGG